MNREAFLSERRSSIGGSDIAAIIGLSPWATAYDVWLDKRGQREEADPDAPALYWGSILEDVVAKEYAKRASAKVQRVNQKLVHPDFAFAAANIDRAVVNPDISGVVSWKDGRLTTDKILECKTANQFTAHMWDEAGTDGIPIYYVVQCMWYLGVTGASICDLAVLIGGSDFRVYTIERDQDLIARLFEAGQTFWDRVKSGVAPQPQTIDDVKRMWPHHTELKSVIVGVDTFNDCKRMAEIKAEIKALEAEAKAAEFRIVTAFEDAEEITHAGERLATWKAQDTTRLDIKALKEAHPDIADLFSKTTTSRVLRLSKAVKG